MFLQFISFKQNETGTIGTSDLNFKYRNSELKTDKFVSESFYIPLDPSSLSLYLAPFKNQQKILFDVFGAAKS